MEKVFRLRGMDDYEGENFVRIFSTFEKAKEYMDSFAVRTVHLDCGMFYKVFIDDRGDHVCAHYFVIDAINVDCDEDPSSIDKDNKIDFRQLPDDDDDN